MTDKNDNDYHYDYENRTIKIVADGKAVSVDALVRTSKGGM